MTPDTAARMIDAMNKILADACPSNVVKEGDSNRRNVGQVAEYWVETHCVGWWVTAKLIAVLTIDGEYVSSQYEILDMKAEDC